MAKFDVEYDVVVIGGGGSGKSAAYTIATESDLSVAVVEKDAVTGGSSVYAEGTGASESSEQKKRGDKVDYPGRKPAPAGAHYPTKEEHVRRYIDYSHHRANMDVVKAFVYNNHETIDMFKSLGIVYSDVTIYAYDQPLELYTFHRPEGLGARCQELLERACLNNGVDIFTSTPARELIIENGRIVGVLCDAADGEMRIGARAVVLAAGGFGNNMDLVGKLSWIPGIAEHNVQSVPTMNTGDGLTMALQAGAATRNLGTLMILSCIEGHTLGCQLHAAGLQPNLWLDSRGKRYCNEEVSMSFADTGNTIAQAEGGRVWSIFTQEHSDYLKEWGSEIGLGDFVVINAPIDCEGEVAEAMAAGEKVAFKANTIAELAKLIGLPVEVVVAEVARYNELAKDGKDTDFYKSPEYLRPIQEGPFYAIQLAPSILVSDGGISVNGNFQVCDEAYEPIAGLYAVGNEASGLYGDTYNLDCPGTANGFAHTSGRLAARHIIKTIG